MEKTKTELLGTHKREKANQGGDVAVFREKGKLGILGRLGILKKLK